MTSETRNLHVSKNLNISKTTQDIEKLKSPLRLVWKCCSVVFKIGSKIFSLQWHFNELWKIMANAFFGRQSQAFTCHQWRSQPEDLVPLCKFLVIIDCEQQSISKEMNNDNVWNFHSGTKLSGWLRHCMPLCYYGQVWTCNRHRVSRLSEPNITTQY